MELVWGWLCPPHHMNTHAFKGNKSSLASKSCMHCGRDMVWRKAWANNWDAVQYCSQRCSADAKRARSTAMKQAVSS